MTSSYRGYARASENLNSGRVVDPSQKILQRNNDYLEDFRRIREFERQQEAQAFAQYQRVSGVQIDSQVDAAQLQSNYGEIVNRKKQQDVDSKKQAMQLAFDQKRKQPSNWDKTLNTVNQLAALSGTVNKLYGDYKKAEAAAKEVEQQKVFTDKFNEGVERNQGAVPIAPSGPVTPASLEGHKEQTNAARISASQSMALSATQQASGDLPGALQTQKNANITMSAVVNPAQQRLMLRQGTLGALREWTDKGGQVMTDNGLKEYKSLDALDKVKYSPDAIGQVMNGMGINPVTLEKNLKFEMTQIASQAASPYFASQFSSELGAARANNVETARTLFRDDPTPINVQGLYVALQQQAGGDDKKARDSLFDEFKSFNYNQADVNTFLDAKVPGLNKSWREQFPGDAQELIRARTNTGIQNAQALDNERQIADIERANAIREQYATDIEDGVYNSASGEEIAQKIKEFTASGDTETVEALKAILPMTVSAQQDERIEENFTELLVNGIQGDLTAKMVIESNMSDKKKTQWLAKVKEFDATAPSKPEYDKAEKWISESLKSRVKFNQFTSQTKDPSISRAIASAMEQYQADYKQAMLAPNMSPAKASEYALGRFETAFGTDPTKGLYRTADPNADVQTDRTSFIDKSFEIQPTEGIYDWNRATINTALSEEPNALDKPGLVNSEVLKNISPKTLVSKGMPAQIQYIASKTNKPAFDILNRQLKANGLEEIPQDVYNAAQEAQNVVNGDLQNLLNRFPSPTRTDIAMIGSGQEPIYRQSIPPSIQSDVEFQKEVLGLSRRLGVSANDLFAIMDFETAGTFDPAQRNGAGSGATGLIQIMPSTAVGLGTTTEALASMSRIEQLKYVEKYFQRTGIQPGARLSDLYMSVLFPAAVGKSDDFILFGKGAMSDYQGNAYTQNRGLDSNGDGSITKAEATAKVVGSANPWRQRRNLNPAVVAATAGATTRTKEQGPGSGYWDWDEQRNLWVKSNAN